MLAKFEQLQKSDVRASRIGTYLERAREGYNDWEINY